MRRTILSLLTAGLVIGLASASVPKAGKWSVTDTWMREIEMRQPNVILLGNSILGRGIDEAVLRRRRPALPCDP